MRRVLFVCTGNLCRSPMAEYMLQHKLGQRGVDSVLVESAGTLAMEGAPPSRKAAMELQSHGIDITGHRARPLSGDMIKEADMVVVMELYHKEAVLSLAPEALDKVVMLGELANGNTGAEIPDPLGHDSAFFAKTFETINKAIEKLADELEKNSR